MDINPNNCLQKIMLFKTNYDKLQLIVSFYVQD